MDPPLIVLSWALQVLNRAAGPGPKKETENTYFFDPQPRPQSTSHKILLLSEIAYMVTCDLVKPSLVLRVGIGRANSALEVTYVMANSL